MKGKYPVEHYFMGPRSQVDAEKDFLAEIFNYMSTSDSKHIVSFHGFLQEQGTDGLLY